MVLGMLTFPIGDTAAKYLSTDYSGLTLATIRFLVGAVVLVPFTLFQTNVFEIRKHLEKVFLTEQLIRSLLIIAATVFFIEGIARLPLADAIGAYLIGPLVAILLAFLVLGESISTRKLVAVFLGFTGALIIVKPGYSMNVGFIFALLAGACYGAYLVAIKGSKRIVSPYALVAIQTTIGSILLIPFCLSKILLIDWSDWWLFAIMGLGSVVANVLTIVALKYASASLLSPLVYVEIVGATILGYVVFGTIPSPATAIGIGIVVLSGFLLLQNSKDNQLSN